MPYAPINGIELYYESHGEGPPIIFAHGRGGNHLSWWQQVGVFSKHHRCIAFDHRGFGYSADVPDGPGRRAYVEDLRALLDHLGIQEAFLVVQSMGGLTGLGFALAYPQRTRGLVLADTTGGIGDESVAGAVRAYQAPTNVLDRTLSRGFRENHPVRTFLYLEINMLNAPRPAEAVSAFANGEGPKAAKLARMKVPTLLIVGKEDAVFPPEIIQKAHQLIPGSRLEIVPDCGHSVYFEHPEVFNRLVSEFIAEVSATPHPVASTG